MTIETNMSKTSDTKAGWKQTNGVWYYLNSDGAMASNTTIEGYTVDSNGAWIE
jgi:glucan-binding YG repeat protein